MSLMRWIRGYDRHSEVLRGQWEISSFDWPLIRRFVTGNPDDPDLLDSYPLQRSQMRVLVTRLNLPIDATEYDYYVETSEDANKVTQIRDAQQLI